MAYVAFWCWVGGLFCEWIQCGVGAFSAVEITMGESTKLVTGASLPNIFVFSLEDGIKCLFLPEGSNVWLARWLVGGEAFCTLRSRCLFGKCVDRYWNLCWWYLKGFCGMIGWLDSTLGSGDID